MVFARGTTAVFSFRRQYCERFSAIRFSIKVGAMLITQNVNGGLAKRNIVLRFAAVLRFAVHRAAKRNISQSVKKTAKRNKLTQIVIIDSIHARAIIGRKRGLAGRTVQIEG